MNGIKNPPNEYNFGLDFNYAQWIPGSTVRLCNVPWNTDYRDIVDFENQAALDAFIDSIENFAITIEDVSYIKPNTPIRLEIPFNAGYRYNYLRVTNPIQPVAGDIQKAYYYFITEVRYLTPSTTEFVLQLDVWQTFGRDITFGNCYIDRGHIGIANENNFNNYGRDYLTIPEGLDVGNEYQIVTRRNEKIIDNSYGAIMVVSVLDLNADPGTTEHPDIVSADGSNFQLMPSGANIYVWKRAEDFLAWLTSVKYTPWVSQGIVSITYIPDLTRYGFTIDETIEPTPAPWSRGRNLKYGMLENWREDDDIVNYIPARYRHLKKFFTYPYMVIELTTFTGNPIVIKPEAWADDDASIIERFTFMPPNQRVAFQPYKYNAIAGSDTDPLYPVVPIGNPNVGGDDSGEYLDFMTQLSNFPTMPIVNDGAISYLASNNSTIGYARQSADWSQTRALRGAEVGYEQATGAMGATAKMANLQATADAMSTVVSNNAQTMSGMVGAAGNILGAGIAGGLRGGPAGMAGAAAGAGGQAIVGGIQNSIQVGANSELSAIRQATGISGAGITNLQQGLVRDTNNDLANFSAKGDYENTIAGINARVQDAQLIQPNVSGQFGGDTLNIQANMFGVSARWKMVDIAAIRTIGEYWLRYGYSVKKFSTLTTLRVMSKFTYWKLLETYITSGFMPESFKQTIRGIFEKGVTVWSDPNDIGTVDLGTNTALEGITL